MGCLDENDGNYSFVIEPDRKIAKQPGLFREFADANLMRAGSVFDDLIRTG